MPRYFFDVRDARGFHLDEIGDECEGIEEAQEHVQALLSDIARKDLPDGELHEMACEVRDQTGKTTYRGQLTYRGTRF